MCNCGPCFILCTVDDTLPDCSYFFWMDGSSLDKAFLRSRPGGGYKEPRASLFILKVVCRLLQKCLNQAKRTLLSSFLACLQWPTFCCL